MTRSEAYAEGFQEGRRWAENDISDGIYVAPSAWDVGNTEYARARGLGAIRGYRDTVARFEAGTLTRQMFEHAPRGGTRA